MALSRAELAPWVNEFEAWHAQNELLLEKLFSDSEPLKYYRGAPVKRLPRNFMDLSKVFSANATSRVSRLDAIKKSLDILDESGRVDPDVITTTTLKDSSETLRNEIFIVHGQTSLRDAVVAEIKQSTNRDAILLQDLPDVGSPTVIEKLEREAKRAGWAVVILVGDDEGRVRGTDELKPRARQNVIAELGYFVALLGRDRVRVLYEPGVELPSDFGGITYTAIDEEGVWRSRLARDLAAMGITPLISDERC